MARLVVVTTRAQRDGFRLAGVAVEAAASAEEADRVLKRLLASRDTGVVAVHEPYLAALPPAVRARLDEMVSPLVVALPEARPGGGESRRARLTDMLRRSVGYRVTFEGEEP